MCNKHPKYKALRVPRVDCDACWEIYKVKYGRQEAILKYLEFFRKKDLTKQKNVV